MTEEIEISTGIVKYLATVGGVAFVILIAVAIVQFFRPSQVESEDEQLDMFRKRTKRIHLGWFDRLTDDGMEENATSIRTNENYR